jgi:hypothetical protein
MTDGLERLNDAWQQADGHARRDFLRSLPMQPGMRGEREITMVSQVNSRDGSPAVLFRWGEHVLIMDSRTAKRHGRAVLETALAAEAEAFLFRWMQAKVGTPPEEAARLLVDFRRWREEMERQDATQGEEGMRPERSMP